MRFILSIGIWIVLVGGLWLFTWQRDQAVVTATQINLDRDVDQIFTLELTTTFDTEKDPFALQIDEEDSSEIELRLNGDNLALPADTVKRGIPMRIDDVRGVILGHNDIYVKASPPVNESDLQQGVRIRILENETVISEQTLWNSGGGLVSGGFGFTYEEHGENNHEH